jgi:DNA mismatch repair protein MLH3
MQAAKDATSQMLEREVRDTSAKRSVTTMGPPTMTVRFASPDPSPKRQLASTISSSPARKVATDKSDIQTAPPIVSSPRLADILAQWKNPCFSPGPAGPDIVTAASSALQSSTEVRLHRSWLHPSSLRVVGQVMDRLIMCVLDGHLLVAFDQHAVHERVLLEQMTQQTLTSGAPPTLRAVAPDQQSLSLSSMQHDAVLRFRDKLLPWFKVSDDATLLLATACVCDETLTQSDFAEHLEALGSGARSSVPRAVDRILSFKACRNAIKFNTPLSKDQCVELMAQLSSCNFPFICAHGRQSCAALWSTKE